MTDKLSVLKYSDLWLEFGFLTKEELNEQIRIFETGEDNSTEHYRYRSFKNYLKSRKKLKDNEIKDYLHLAEIDEDKIMSGAAVVDQLQRKSLTDVQFEKVCNALSFYGEWTKKVISREIIFRDLNKFVSSNENLTEKTFLKFFSKRIADVDRFLIQYADKNQMKLIAEKGATKAVRNIAKQKLRSGKFRNYGEKSAIFKR